MRKIYRRLIAGVFAALMLVTLLPFQAFAVDPVSAVTMANALAQALTAYGASHGVSMMFDVSDTSGIGEGLHDLWGQFKSDINDNDVPTYDSLAITIWANLYSKVRNSVAVNVSAENVGYFDQFWNWLLSGPAQMQKVDNQYYEWTMNSQTNQVEPISVLSVPFLSIGPYTIPSAYNYGNSTVYITNYPGISDIKADNAYIYGYLNGDYVYFIQIVYDYTHSDVAYMFKYGREGSGILVSNGVPAGNRWNYRSNIAYWDYDANKLSVSGNNIPQPVYNISPSSMLSQYSSSIAIDGNYVSVRPYVGDTVPQNVPIPDTDDPDYSPLPYVGPLGVPWIDNNFGDGQSLTDAQREVIADALDNAIEDDGTLTLEEDQTVPDNPGSETIGGPSAYTVPGLADVFPFCIPFDIYNFLQALAADPTPPHFTAQLAFPEAIGGTQEIDIDFDSPTWNRLAQLLRLLELLLFIIGLAFVTRSMFIRG